MGQVHRTFGMVLLNWSSMSFVVLSILVGVAVDAQFKLSEHVAVVVAHADQH